MQTKLYRKIGSLLYWCSYTDERGYPVEHCTGSANLTEAQIIAARFGVPPTDQGGGTQNQKSCQGPTLAETLAHFLSFCRLDRSEATVVCYEQKAGHLVRLMGEVELKALHVDHVHAYARRRLSEGAARETVRKDLVVLRGALQLARDRGLVAKAPDEVIPRFRASYKPRQRWMKVEELSELLRNLEDKWQRWVMVAVFTGARLSEVESLRWRDVDFESKQIHIRGTKTQRADRKIPLHRELAELLKPHQGKSGEAVAGKWHNVRRDLGLACAKARIEPVTPNDLRRTFASWLKQAGQDSLAVGRLLGHTSSRMVELVYGHLDQRSLSRAVDSLPSASAIAAQVGEPSPTQP